MVIETTEQLLAVPLTQDEQSLVARVRAYDKSEKYLPKLPLAIQFAKTAHAGQRRASGEDFFIHPLIVANTLADISMDSLTIIAALLHDVVEDTEVSLEKIEELFGEKVAFLVDGVTKLTKIEGKSENILQTENFRKLIIAISKDIRVLIIKLADRLHNMQTLSHLSSITKRGRIALETVDVYANLAERVGMHVIKSQLQDLAFAILHPNSRESIVRRLDLLKRGDSIKLVRKISDTLASLIESQDIEVKVIGREKTPFSIWEKMKRKNISFEQLSDVMAFRVVVPTIPDCYKALWVIHSNYHVVPGRFKDFISLPKENRYRSIHTVIMGPEKQRIEIQIRTVEMHRVAEHGIAAHWGYKQQYEGKDKEGYNWLRGLLNLSESTTNFSEVLENTKTEIYTDQIFCFTPKGAVIALPKGASVIDFAYAVHSEVGNACVGAKINYKMAPLKTKLQNGDQVEITTSQEAKPSPDWEQFSITGKALNEIRKAVKQERNKELFHLGEALLKTLFLQQNKAFVPEGLVPIATAFNKETVEELMCAIGDGTIRAEAIWEKLYPMIKLVPLKRNKKRKLTANDDIPIKGLTPGISIHLAPCCSPILGDRIVGIMLNRKGITVHVSDCETLQHYEEDPNLWVNLSWDKTAAPQTFTGAIKIVLRNIAGALAEVTLEIARNEANISNFKTVSRERDFFEINLDIEIQNQKQLANIISAVKSKHCVHSIERIIR